MTTLPAASGSQPIHAQLADVIRQIDSAAFYPALIRWLAATLIRCHPFYLLIAKPLGRVLR